MCHSSDPIRGHHRERPAPAASASLRESSSDCRCTSTSSCTCGRKGCRRSPRRRLSELTEVNAAQIRRDLAYFGQFGKRGVGYDVGLLVDRIQRILGSDHIQRLAIVGAGNLGSAIAQYDGLRTRGFIVAGLFDSDPRKVGTRVGDLIVRDISELERVVREQAIRFGVIAVPPETAQEVADRLCDGRAFRWS